MKEQEPRQNGKKRKPIPIISYLCGLLAVAVLFTGTTFSRYSTQISGDVQTNLSPFVASYTIQDISSTTFPNMDYWLQVNQSGDETDYRPGSVARTVRFTISNTKGSRRSGVDLQSSIRLRVPAELGDNLVLQVVEVEEPAHEGDTAVVVNTPLTPQYIIGNLVYQTEPDLDDNGKSYTYTYLRDEKGNLIDEKGNLISEDSENKIQIQKFRTKASIDEMEEPSLDTGYFKDYSSFEGAVDEILTLTGGLDGKTGEGTIMAEAPDTKDKDGKTIKGNRISVTSVLRETEYSIGYQRGVDENDYQSQLFLDLRGKKRFYTIDITLPEMYLERNASESHTFVLYVTLAESVEFDDAMGGGSGEDNTGENNAEWKNYDFLTAESGAPVHTFGSNDDVVIGYHFETSKVPIYNYTGNAPTPRTGETTTVRVTKRYGISGNGDTATYTENDTITFQHIAPLTTEQSAQAAIYAHDIRIGTYANGTLTFIDSISLISDITESKNNYGQCSNYENMPDKERYLIGLDGLTDNPLAVPQGGTYKLFGELSRKYNAQLTVLFVQASEAPTENGVDGEETA